MTAPSDVVDRLCVALNDHDLDALAACFAADYRNETPVHPARGFVGREQVRRNWEQLFGGNPDLAGTVTARAVVPDGVWTEWEMRGTRRDGARHLMRGVMVFRLRDGSAESLRFFLEPVDEGGPDADAAVATLAAGRP